MSDDDGCCARPDGHPGECQWLCSDCNGTGICLECNDECFCDDVVMCPTCDGTHQCMYCDYGMVVEP